MNTTLIKKDGIVSVHTSFQKACDAYGWDRAEVVGYKKTVPEEYKGYSISKQQTDLTVPCIALREFLETKGVSSSDYEPEHEDELKTVIFDLGEERDYIVEVELRVRIVEGEIATDLGPLNDDQTEDKIESINRIINCEGEEIKLDGQTEEILKTKLYEYLY